ncbi:MAE_28990/MAE_18760 family HEPN-like nuclease [Aeromonas sp. sia0103]|uniref:MAE_28990/MAE_18760 family HEPN-like nuclease n=1 Tax=Aeromonas sp. sia0103 TaxID=2854782 RepID=UPI001C488CFF|nr:MAE_28990/MAE_18760 family HEPN-like nuclease [Aeromonas sp. sia0103]MBV7597132.1 hypothetical protein [Aeromonas sp. sia0103]
MPSKARKALSENLNDIDKLLELHASEGGNGRGRRYDLEVLNKSAIVLICSYWEAYCEDLAEEALEHILVHSLTSDTLPLEIKKIISKELKKDNNELSVWEVADGKWKQYLSARLEALKEERNRRLNTPKSSNIDDLFEKSIGLKNISSKWKWAKKLTVEGARDKLDKFIELRGEIAHRGKSANSVKKIQVTDFRQFIENLAAKTGGSVNTHVKSVTGKPLWESTKKAL